MGRARGCEHTSHTEGKGEGERGRGRESKGKVCAKGEKRRETVGERRERQRGGTLARHEVRRLCSTGGILFSLKKRERERKGDTQHKRAADKLSRDKLRKRRPSENKGGRVGRNEEGAAKGREGSRREAVCVCVRVCVCV